MGVFSIKSKFKNFYHCEINSALYITVKKYQNYHNDNCYYN